MPFSHTQRTWVEIDREALLKNFREIKSLLAPKTQFLVVVKANAYGHGLTEIGSLLNNHVDWFGVDLIDEALILRKLGIKKPILVMGYTPADRAAEIIRNDLRQIVYDLEMVGALDDASRHLGGRANVHVKIETGMARHGIHQKNLSRFLSALPEFPNVEVEGIATHFANADDVNDASFMQMQLSRFHLALETFRGFNIVPRFRHAGASAATLLHATTHFDLVRVGIALYGIWPTPELASSLQQQNRRTISLAPVLRFKTRIAQVNDLEEGASVGYGLSERVGRSSRIAILPIGYADGYDRGLSSIGTVLIAGKRAKILGRVMMNITVVDVTDIPEAQPGAVVTLIGRDGDDEITADSLADLLDTISYEIVSRINPLLPRAVV